MQELQELLLSSDMDSHHGLAVSVLLLANFEPRLAECLVRAPRWERRTPFQQR